MSAPAASIIDIAAILVLLFICQPELTEDPHSFVIRPRWWWGECVRKRTHGKKTLALFRTHTFRSLLWMLSSVIWIHKKAAFQTCLCIILLDLSQERRFLSWAVNENLTCECHVGLKLQAEWERAGPHGMLTPPAPRRRWFTLIETSPHSFSLCLPPNSRWRLHINMCSTYLEIEQVTFQIEYVFQFRFHEVFFFGGGGLPDLWGLMWIHWTTC